ncbi:conserved membrane hypothetical protein [Pseudomonas sp. OF001]|uniref:hypothetical protein n=1 Tax=Pseudomonas sp. OF001 TaxID=2772300 RepID=UPI00191B7EDE|nr:hypothetical protein [Pseudomonas sp. OF001]CAD5378986.1 conserved membrane hypothetical protein [Pseudomonas sp. OF001]
MHNLITRYRWPLLAMVALLAGVTSASVAMAIQALIDDALLAGLFATAAVVLDLFKYVAWPLALGLLAMRRALCALLMMGCALALGGVSGWATYDRLMSSIATSRAEHQALQVQRQADLEELRRADAARIEQLDAEAAGVRQQSGALRDRGMVSRALELETAAMVRIDTERDRALARRDAASQELTALRSQPAKAAGLPLEIATLLCLSFAAALEIVPALILSALRPAPAAEREPETVTAQQERTEEQAETIAQEQPETAQDKARSEEVGVDSALPEPLLQLIASTESGTKMAVRRVAKELRIGSDKATKLMQKAAGMGVLNKTDAGYVTA